MITISNLLFVSFFLLAIAKKTGKFSLPITKHEGAVLRVIPLQSTVQSNKDESAQKPLNMGPKPDYHSITAKEDFQSRGNPIKIPHSPFPIYTYITNLSVGTPPQSFRAVVDLNWADLILPSSTCVSAVPRFCNPSNATYNASASSTYHNNGTLTTVRYGPLSAKTRLSEDVLTFVNEVQVPSQIFHEITHYTDWSDMDNLGVPFPDGILGLAIGKEFIPGQFGTPNILPSPFRSMVDQKVLEKNMFSIVFPSDEREQGSLTFGGYDEDLLDGELISHPIYPKNATKWQFEIQSVSMKGSYNCGPERLLMHKKIPNTKALLLSTHPFVGFHGPIAAELLHYINGWNDGCAFLPRVSCDDLSSLPEIIIGLKGQNITVRGKDYVSKVTVPDTPGCSDPHDDRDRCYVMVNWLGGPGDVVILGTPFLERVMGVWNWDTQTVSFGNLKQ